MTSRIVPPMIRSDRDTQVIQMAAKYECVTAKQFRGVLFSTCRSDTSCDNVLNRLVKQKYLARYDWRYRKDNGGGSGEYVYQLGPNGWKLIGYEGTYKKLLAFDRHKLAITDLYVQLMEYEYAGLIELLEHETEPNNWERIGQELIKPDLYARIKNLRTGVITRYWFEVDLGTEHQRQLMEKIRRYVKAWDAADSIPIVPWVVPDERRKLEIGRLIGKLRTSDLELFRVSTWGGLANVLIA